MNPQNFAVRGYTAVSAAGVISLIGMIANATGSAFYDYPEISAWTILFDATTSAFNGTVNMQLASGDITLGTIVTPASIMMNGGASATFTQPAAFAGSGVLLWVFQFPLPLWRLNITAYTSGTLRLWVTGV